MVSLSGSVSGLFSVSVSAIVSASVSIPCPRTQEWKGFVKNARLDRMFYVIVLASDNLCILPSVETQKETKAETKTETESVKHPVPGTEKKTERDNQSKSISANSS